jgi:outer membrane lipoprotein-sorting protein
MMNTNRNTEKLDELISRAISREAPKFEFDKWKQSHEKEIRVYELQTTGQMLSHSVRIVEIGRMIMKSRISKIAAAAVIIIAIFTVTHFVGNPIESMAWADVVQPILTARTIAFNLVMAEGEDVPITRVMNMGTQRIRSEVLSPDGKTIQVIVIVDYDTSLMLQLIPGQKMATLIEMKDVPEDEVPENILKEMRNIITELQNDPDVSIESLDEKEIDGRTAKGFRATSPDGEVMVWADPETALPIRVEQTWRQIRFVCTDFQFDTEMDESLFNMEIPEGYSEPVQGELSFEGSTEEDLVRTLRVWAENILDGVFPKDFTGQVYVEDTKRNRHKFVVLTKEEKLKMAMKISPGFIFVHLLKDENDWHYVGNNIKLGDADAPVCWYRPTDSETYRVIYGDLSIKDIVPKDLPK